MVDSEQRQQVSPPEKQDAEDEETSSGDKMLPCRLYSFVTGVVLMIVVILFGVPRDDKLHTQSSQRVPLPMGADGVGRSSHPSFDKAAFGNGPALFGNYSGNVDLTAVQSLAGRHEKITTIRGEGPRPMPCIVSVAATHPAQFPKKNCTHLVYQDIEYQPAANSFIPVNSATFSSLRIMAELTKQRVLVAVTGTRIEELALNLPSADRFASTAANWLSEVGLHGLAFIGHKSTSEKLPALGPFLKELRATLGRQNRELLLGITVEDWDTPTNLVTGRLAAIAPNVDFLILETHYRQVRSSCVATYSSVFYADNPSPATVPIGRAISWMSELVMEHNIPVFSCFSITLGAVLFKGVTKPHSACRTSETVNYMKVCKGTQWKDDTRNLNALAELRLGNAQIESHESELLLRSKISHAVTSFPLACVAPYDVDLDDYDGQCGARFARLGLIQQILTEAAPRAAEVKAQSLANSSVDAPPAPTGSNRKHRCMAPGRENTRPLVCVLSDRTDMDRNISKLLCTHIVLSLRRFGQPYPLVNISEEYLMQLKGPGVKVLVALHERLLLTRKTEQLAESTAVMLKGSQLDGVAFLYVMQSIIQLENLTPKLQVLHDIYKAAGLCFILSLQILDNGGPSGTTTNVLRDVSTHVDIMVLNTHFPGLMGPCRAVPVTTAVQPSSSCIPTVAVETALQWVKSIGEVTDDAPFLCLSVDMRAFRFGMYGKSVLHGTCNLEERLDMLTVCSDPGWVLVSNVSLQSPVWRKGSTLQTYDTVESLRKRVKAVAALPNTCIAAFNYDYDDHSGDCHDGVPHARLMSVRAALDGENLTSHQAHRYQSIVRPLVCTLSAGIPDRERLPSSHCTHLIYEGASYDTIKDQLVIPDKMEWLAASISGMQHLVGIEAHSIFEWLLPLSESEVGAIAENLSLAIRASKMHGLAFLNFNRTSRTISKFGTVLATLRQTFPKNMTLVLGVEVLDSGLPASVVAERLLSVARYVDIMILQTHYRRPHGYCQISYPSVYQGQGTTLSLATASSWSRLMDVNAHVCVSFTLGVLEFEKTDTNSTAYCDKQSLLGYAATCDDKDWVMEENTSSSLYVRRKKKGLVQTYESPSQLAHKVSLGIDTEPSSCVALFNVDLEDSTEKCLANRRKFGRLAAVAEKYVEAKNRFREDQVLRRLPKGALKDDPAELIGYALPQPARSYMPSRARSTVYRPDTMTSLPEKRPFVCVLSTFWKNVLEELLPSQCTHIIVDLGTYDNQNEQIKNGRDPVLRLKDALLPHMKLFVRVTGWKRLSSSDIAAHLMKSLKRVNGDGVALTDVRIFSVDAASLAAALQNLQELLPKSFLLILGLELADPDEASLLITQRLSPLFEYVDLLILQTHFRKVWHFCRTAHTSLYESPEDDNCLQTTSTSRALHWMTLLEPFAVPTCLSVNMAAIKFHTIGTPAAGSPCEETEEIADACASGTEWAARNDRNLSLKTSPPEDNVWVTQETESLLREKLSKSYKQYPKFCVAVFNVDLDGIPSKCTKKDETFHRVAEAARAANYENGSLLQNDVSGSDNISDENLPPSSVHSFTGARSLVCIFSPSSLNLERFPMQLCSYVVFTHKINDDSPVLSFRPQDDKKFELFLRKSTKTKTKAILATSPSLLATLHKDGMPIMEAMQDLSTYLKENGLRGLAVLASPSANLEALDNLLEGTRNYFQQNTSDLKLIVGVHYSPTNADILKRLSRHSDLIIFFTHRLLHGNKCAIVQPTSPVLKETDFEIMKEAAEPSGHTAATCFSVNLAVFGFKPSSPNASIGDSCLNRRLENYARTCPTKSGITISDTTWVASFKSNNTWIQTFEDENSLSKKAATFLKVHPLGCIAAVYADFEDSKGECSKRLTHSRVRLLSGLLGVTNSSGKERVKPPENEKRPRRNKLVCFVAPSITALLQLPFDSCDYVVYSTQDFHSVENVTENLASWGSLLPNVEPGASLAIGINSKTLVSMYINDLKAGALLVEYIPTWLSQNAVGAVAVLSDVLPSTEELLFFRILKDLKQSLKSVDESNLELILAISSGSELFHRDIIELADVFVYVDYHEASTNGSCKVTLPSVSRNTKSLTAPLLLAKELMENGNENTSFCITLNLAVLKFETNATAPKLGSDCATETLVDYSQVCTQKKSKAVFNMNWMTASLQSGDILYTFEKEDMLLSKVLFMKAWYPSLCVALFRTEFDASAGSCSARSLPFSRLLSVRSGLDSAVHEEHWEQGRHPPP